MEPEETVESPGKYLQAKRESKRLSLKRVADATNIREGILKAIEEDKYEDLPALYVKSFLRSYARYLGLDPDEVVRLHHKILGNAIVSRRKVAKRQPAPRKRKVNVRRLVIFISALLLAALLVYASLKLLQRVFFFFANGRTRTFAISSGTIQRHIDDIIQTESDTHLENVRQAVESYVEDTQMRQKKM